MPFLHPRIGSPLQLVWLGLHVLLFQFPQGYHLLPLVYSSVKNAHSYGRLELGEVELEKAYLYPEIHRVVTLIFESPQSAAESENRWTDSRISLKSDHRKPKNPWPHSISRVGRLFAPLTPSAWMSQPTAGVYGVGKADQLRHYHTLGLGFAVEGRTRARGHSGRGRRGS